MYFVIVLIKLTSDLVALSYSISKLFKSSEIGEIISFKEGLIFCHKRKILFYTNLFQLFLLRVTIQDTPILASYSKANGNDIINIETGSGGVMKDETINIAIMECLR